MTVVLGVPPIILASIAGPRRGWISAVYRVSLYFGRLGAGVCIPSDPGFRLASADRTIGYALGIEGFRPFYRGHDAAAFRCRSARAGPTTAADGHGAPLEFYIAAVRAAMISGRGRQRAIDSICWMRHQVRAGSQWRR